MPIYEYECDGCHQVFAVRQKISDPAPQQHDCGSHEIRRILSATSFVLKGTGWYKTDYADKEPGKARPQESSEDKPAKPAHASKDGGVTAEGGKHANTTPSKDDGGAAKASLASRPTSDKGSADKKPSPASGAP